METMNHPQVDPNAELMAEAARAAEQINFNAHGGTVYGAPEQIDPAHEAQVIARGAEHVGSAIGAAEVNTEYVNENQRGVIASRVAAANQAHTEQSNMFDQFLRETVKAEDKKKVDA
jgi:hypothetical protein